MSNMYPVVGVNGYPIRRVPPWGNNRFTVGLPSKGAIMESPDPYSHMSYIGDYSAAADPQYTSILSNGIQQSISGTASSTRYTKWWCHYKPGIKIQVKMSSNFSYSSSSNGYLMIVNQVIWPVMSGVEESEYFVIDCNNGVIATNDNNKTFNLPDIYYRYPILIKSIILASGVPSTTTLTFSEV